MLHVAEAAINSHINEPLFPLRYYVLCPTVHKPVLLVGNNSNNYAYITSHNIVIRYKVILGSFSPSSPVPPFASYLPVPFAGDNVECSSFNLYNGEISLC